MLKNQQPFHCIMSNGIDRITSKTSLRFTTQFRGVEAFLMGSLDFYNSAGLFHVFQS